MTQTTPPSGPTGRHTAPVRPDTPVRPDAPVRRDAPIQQDAPVRPDLPPGGPCSPAAPWRALAIVLAGAFMAVLDTFIVLVAAPAIQADLHSSAADVQLILAGYQLSYALALITGARLGDRFGRKRLFMTGMALFTLSSVGCALAPGSGSLIAARLVQGLGAAAMFPQVFAVIQVLIPAARRPKAFGVLGAVIGMATMSGQLVGGLLIAADLFGTSWRPVFWVNVPVGLLTLLLAGRFVPESRAPEARRLDLPGAVVLTVALSLLVVPLVEGRAYGWPLWAWLGLAASIPAFAAFGLVERRVAAVGGTPLVRLRLLRERPFAVGMTLVVLTYAGINSLFLVLSLTLQDGLGMDALGAGLVYTPFAVAFFAASLLAGRLARFGRRVLLLGALTGALGFIGTIALTLNAGATLTAWELVPTLLLVGAGNGLLVTPLLNAVLGTIRPAEVGMASGVLSTGQQIGGAVGVALVGILYYGALGDAAHHDTGAYGHALAAALVLNVALAAAISALLPFLPDAATRRG
ncbi:MFS transporter [Streptomyces sp. MCA2]|uniref:MFS transporter n=1 Tax=Streptomyces sp. MCA2 TaxID=2944805 RepID=UPI002020C6D9|nr:MFS transporter [Streptomyces sp. MCA2]MCL7495644.1 MFS transporter [Streptomyces sp. MCA2]